jgi:hypothetical protein
MSYYEDGLMGLGDLPAGAAVPTGSRYALGFQVTGLTPTTSPQAVSALRAVVGTAFRGNLVAAGWGPAYGVPSGRLYAVLETARGLTGADLNTVAHMIIGALPSRLPGTTVANTNFHQVGGSGGGSGAAATITGAIDPVTGLLAALTPGTATPDPAAYYPVTTEPNTESFFTQDVGGVPVWGLLAGGVVAIGAIAYVFMGKPKTAAAVTANRKSKRGKKQRRRRNRRGRWLPGGGYGGEGGHRIRRSAEDGPPWLNTNGRRTR